MSNQTVRGAWPTVATAKRFTGLRGWAVLLVLAAVALLTPRPAHAMQNFMDNIVAPYGATANNLFNLCANCHADWNGQDTGPNVRPAYMLYMKGLTATTTNTFYTLDVDYDGVSNGQELANANTPTCPPPGTRWMPSHPDKDGDGYIQLYYRSDENGMPLTAANIILEGRVGAAFQYCTPTGWDIDDNDAAQGNAGWDRFTGPAVTPGTTLDVTPPAKITDLRASGMASGALPLVWTAPGDDGSVGTAHNYDLRYTTAQVLMQPFCGGGTLLCNVRLASHWEQMYDIPDTDVDGSTGTYLSKAGGTLATPAGPWNAGVAAPLMRALYEPLPVPAGNAQSYTLTMKGTVGGSTITTNIISDGTTYWLAIRAGDGVVKPTHVETPTGFTENVSPVSNIVAMTAGPAGTGVAIQSYSPATLTTTGGTLTLNGLGLNATNAAQVVLTNSVGTPVTNGTATGAAITYNAGGLTANFGTLPTGTYNIEVRTAAGGTANTKAAWVNAVIVVSDPLAVVTNVTSSLANGTYTVGQIVPVQVTFSAPVTVTGTPTLTLDTGTPATTAVNYTTGSGSNTLTFNYTVAAGNTSPDLDYVSPSSLALNGTINASGSPATLTLPAPGDVGSLGYNKNIVIDTTAPAAPVISTVAGNDIVNAAEKAACVTITGGNVESGATVSVTWGATTKVATVSGTSWSVTFCAGEIPPDGASTVSATQTDVAGNTSAVGTRVVTLDTVSPATGPTINSVAGDDVVTAAEKTAGVTITGTNLAGHTVRVYWLGTSGGTPAPGKLVTATTATTWSVTFSAAEIPADGSSTMGATQYDAADNPSPTTTRLPSLIPGDVQPPGINTVAGDDRVNAAEKAACVTITGTNLSGATAVYVTWGSVTKTATITGTNWSVTFCGAEMPMLDGATTVTATQVVSGTSSMPATRSVTVDATPPVVTVNPICGDYVCSAAEKAAGVTISGTVNEPATVSVTWGGITKAATVTGNTWSVTFISAQVPADGTTTVIVTATDMAGNSATVSVPMEIPTPPPAPTINTVAGDDIVNDAENAVCVTITGTNQSGSTVVVTWGAVTKVATVTGTTWSVTFCAPQIPADGSTTVSASQTDTAGNTSAVSTRTVLVDTTAPTVTASPASGTYSSAQSVTLTASESAAICYSIATGTTNATVPEVTAAGNGCTTGTLYAAAISISATSTLRYVAMDTAGNSGVESGQQTYTISSASQPFIPSAQMTSINASVAADGAASVQVTVTLPDPSYFVENWGTVTRSGNTFTVDASFAKRDGGGGTIQIIVDVWNTYNLGILEAGNYEFVFTSRGNFVDDIPFTVSVGDVTPPTIPTGLTATPVSSTRINLSWSAATDNVAVTQYKIYRQSCPATTPDCQQLAPPDLIQTLVGTPPVTTYADTTVSEGMSYDYYVEACDAANNCSGWSSMARATPIASTIDLLPTALSTTATAVAPGKSLSLSSTLKNQGNTAAGAFVTAFHLSVDAVYGGADDIAFTATRSITSLAAGASSMASTTLTVPSTTPTGNYYVCAMTDSGLAIGESDENNNTRCIATPIQIILPDFVMLDVTPTSPIVDAGGSMTINYAYQSAIAMTAASTDLRFYLSPDNNVTGATGSGDILLGSKAVSGTLPGPSSIQGGTVTLKVPATTARGPYYVCAILDLSNRVAESNETNNSKCSDMPITVRRIVDLVMTQVSTAASSVDSGYSFNVDSIETNQGITGMTVTSNQIKFYLSPDNVVTGATGSGDILLTGTRTVSGALGAGASSTFAATSVKIPGTTLPGTYYVCAIADATNAEKLELLSDGVSSGEYNNGSCSATPLQVKREIDLVVGTIGMPLPFAVDVGSSFIYTNTICNNGTTGAIATSTARFYFSMGGVVTSFGDILLGSRSVPILAAGACSTADTLLKVPGTMVPGTYYLCTLADATNTQPEINETNNGLCSAATIQVLRAVDLVMTETSTASTSVAKGSTLVINNTERNQGTTGMTVTSNTIRFYLSPDNIVTGATGSNDILLTGTRTVTGALAAGASSASAPTTVTVPATTAVTPGNYYVCSLADATNVEKLEVSETNNGMCTATTIAITL